MRIGPVVLMVVLSAGIACTAAVPTLSGTWAMIQIYPQTAVLPFAGEVPRSSLVAQIVTVVQTGSSLLMLDRYCFTDVDDGTVLVDTEIPETFMAALDPAPRYAELRETEEGIRFEQLPYVEVRGAILQNPAEDPLPNDVDDPRVVDQDGDGQPGMTVRVTVLGIVEGETYIVQRVRYRLLGFVIGPDRIEGRIEWADEQVVLEATNELLETDTIGAPAPEPEASRFVMIRADTSWTCETLRERLPELLGSGPDG